MAEPRYSDERQQLLERLARGRCAAVQRTKPFPGGLFCWLPTVDGEIVAQSGDSGEFTERRHAVAAARAFQSECRQQLAETNGSM